MLRCMTRLLCASEDGSARRQTIPSVESRTGRPTRRYWLPCESLKSLRLSLSDWAVLGVVAERLTHGWPVVRELAADGALGEVWTVPRPIVYRSLSALAHSELIEACEVDVERPSGPKRTTFRVTRSGRSKLSHWLQTPVAHVRDVRSEFMLKYALLTRAGKPTRRLVDRQLDELAPVLKSLRAERAEADGFDAVLLRWRTEQAEAVVGFLRSLRD